LLLTYLRLEIYTFVKIVALIREKIFIVQMKYLIFFFFILQLHTALAQTVVFDNFQRSDNSLVGATWLENETVVPGSASVLNNQLRLGSNVSGKDYVSADISTLYNSVFSTNTSLLTWAFNMRQTRVDPSGFDAGNYGIAFVLGCSTSNFLTGSGYAVVLGNSGSSDNLRLVKFNAGIASNVALINLIAPALDFGSDYLTVKVTFNPLGNNWILYLGSNLASFDDPATASYTQIGATVSDNTHTSTDLLYLGCFWNHNTGASDFGYFDNILIPSLCTLAPEPTVQTSALNSPSIGANSVTLNWTKGNGSECLLIARQGAAVTAVPVDGTVYQANSVFGSGTAVAPGEFVIYKGSGTSVAVIGLMPSTFYTFKILEYNGSSCTVNYLQNAAATHSLTTVACIPAAQPNVAPSALIANVVLSNSIDLSWTRGNGAYCILLAKEAGAITSPPTDGFTYAASATFGIGNITAPGEFVVYSGTGNSVTIIGLQAGTAYYFELYEFNGTGCNSNYLNTSASLQITTQNAVSYYPYFGNLHSHSDYSDGDMDNVCNGVSSATCCYNIGNTALNFNYMGLSDHNHNEGPVMTLAKYNSGVAEAAAYNSTHNDFVAFYGMEWGTISTGGHANVYGINQLVGWNSGNYSIYCAKGDYSTLFGLVASTPNAFATLNHPNAGDFGNIQGIAYNPTFDNAIVGVALRNGPFNSTSVNYNDPSSSNYISYYHTLLSKGYHLGPLADLDNHNSATMGKSSQQRTVLLATELTKDALLDAVLNMRFYASDDFNAQVNFKINGSLNMGSISSNYANPILSASATDPDGDAITSIRIYYGVPGSGAMPTLLTSVNNSSTLNFTHSFGSGTYYYYAEFTQSDGNLIWTAPIWYTKNSPLPIQLISFKGKRIENANHLTWSTASEINNAYFLVQRSTDGTNFTTIGKVKGAGTSNTTLHYEFIDNKAVSKYNYYRLSQTDYDGKFDYSTLVFIAIHAEPKFSVYPNPAESTVNVDLSEMGIRSNLTLLGSDGKLIYHKEELPNTVHTFSVSDFPNGLYHLRIESNGKILSQKLLIEK
jgi:hypothetical protein